MSYYDSSEWHRESEKPVQSQNNYSSINYFIKLTLEWFNTFQNISCKDQSDLYFYLIPTGSVTYHRLFPCNRKDFVLCFPSNINSTIIRDSYIPSLIRNGRIMSLVIHDNSNEDILKIKFKIESNLFDISICYFPLAYCQTKKPNFNMIDPPTELLDQLTKSSLDVFNGLRNCLIIHKLMKPNLSIFKSTLFFLKKWATLKLIYSKLFYLNGVSLSIMLANIFQKNIPADSIFGNLYLFFRFYTEFNWSNNSIELKQQFDNDDQNDEEQCSEDKRSVMNVMTPTKPKKNCLTTITIYSLNRILNYFKEALFQLEKSVFEKSYSEHFHQPLTLVNFYQFIIQTIYKPNHLKFPLKIFVVSLIETKFSLISMYDSSFLIKWQDIKDSTKLLCQTHPLLPFPLLFHNNLTDKSIYSDVILRRRHILLFSCDRVLLSTIEEFYKTNIKLSCNDNEEFLIEQINDFNHILSMNFDHYIFISQLIELTYY